MSHLSSAEKQTPLAGCLFLLRLHPISRDDFIPWGSKGCSPRQMTWISGPTEMSRGEARTRWALRTAGYNSVNAY